MSDYKTIRTDGQGEIIEKKSRFIGEVHYAKDLSEAESFLTAARKKYYDARHHCFACIVGAPGTPDEILRSNDDGEPGGTAGKPMLEVLTGEGLHYAAAVVTRYFGGVLLGTGGLVRAYTKGARIALDAGGVVTMESCTVARLSCDYSQYGKVSGLIPANGGVIDDTAFTDKVEISFHIPGDALGTFGKQLADATCGAVEAEIIEERYFKKI